MTRSNTCKEQSCNEEVQEGHHLCREHWWRKRKGAINECPQCGVYKDAKYPFCIECNKKANAVHRRNQKSAENKQKTRRYDPVRDDTFDERADLLRDDPKAEDKRQLFHDQERKCVYCGNVHPYDELQIEHMIPKVLGGSDNIRNCQLACRRCNQAKGTMTDIEFRKKYASYLPQQERTPAQPLINPERLQASASPPRPSSEASSHPKDPVERRNKPEHASPSRTEELRRKLGLV